MRRATRESAARSSATQRLALRRADHADTVIPTTCPPAADAPSDAAAIAPS